MAEEINHERRHLFSAAALAFVAAQFEFAGCSSSNLTPAESAESQSKGKKMNTSFAPLKQIKAGVLSVGFAEAGCRRRSFSPIWREQTQATTRRE